MIVSLMTIEKEEQVRICNLYARVKDTSIKIIIIIVFTPRTREGGMDSKNRVLKAETNLVKLT